MSSDWVETIVSLYYTVYICIVLAAHSLLLLLIAYRTTGTLKNFKIYLINTSFTQICLAVLAASMQIRLITAEDALGIITVGIARHLPPYPRFCIYIMVTVFLLSVACSIANAIWYKYQALTGKVTISRNFIFFYTPPLICLILPLYPTWDFDTVMNHTARAHPEYDLQSHMPYPGFSQIDHFCFMTANSIMLFVAIAIPTFCFYIRHRVMKMLTMHNLTYVSQRTKTSTTIMIHCLTCQATMPVICYCPLMITYLYSQHTGSASIFFEYLYYMSCTLPCAIDPFFTIYFVAPFRQTIVRSMGKRIEEASVNVIRVNRSDRKYETSPN